MLKNNKININLGDDIKITPARRAKNKAEIRRNWRWLRGANCATCSNECGPGLGVCFQLLYTNRVLQLENAGGKSEMLFAVNVSEAERTVPVEVYQQLLQAFADYKASAEPKSKTVEAAEEPAQPKPPKKEPSKTSSDAPTKEKASKPSDKKAEYPMIKEGSDPFEGLDAGSNKNRQITIAEIEEEYTPLPL